MDRLLGSFLRGHCRLAVVVARLATVDDAADDHGDHRGDQPGDRGGETRVVECGDGELVGVFGGGEREV